MFISASVITLFVWMLSMDRGGCYPDGNNVDSVCDSMKPNHEGSTEKTTLLPYSISFCPTYYKPNSTVTVTISNSSSTAFKGFMAQARNSANARIGTFTTTSNSRSACSGAAIVHNGSKDKSRISFNWIAPAAYAGNLTFRLTFVQEEHTFWINKPSDTLFEWTSTTVNQSCIFLDDISSSVRPGISGALLLLVTFLYYAF